MSGWNLPPGCSDKDLPGNSDADIAYERAGEVAWERFEAGDYKDEMEQAQQEALEAGEDFQPDKWMEKNLDRFTEQVMDEWSRDEPEYDEDD